MSLHIQNQSLKVTHNQCQLRYQIINDHGQ